MRTNRNVLQLNTNNQLKYQIFIAILTTIVLLSDITLNIIHVLKCDNTEMNDIPHIQTGLTPASGNNIRTDMETTFKHTTVAYNPTLAQQTERTTQNQRLSKILHLINEKRKNQIDEPNIQDTRRTTDYIPLALLTYNPETALFTFYLTFPPLSDQWAQYTHLQVGIYISLSVQLAISEKVNITHSKWEDGYIKITGNAEYFFTNYSPDYILSKYSEIKYFLTGPDGVDTLIGRSGRIATDISFIYQEIIDLKTDYFSSHFNFTPTDSAIWSTMLNTIKEDTIYTATQAVDNRITVKTTEMVNKINSTIASLVSTMNSQHNKFDSKLELLANTVDKLAGTITTRSLDNDWFSQFVNITEIAHDLPFYITGDDEGEVLVGPYKFRFVLKPNLRKDDIVYTLDEIFEPVFFKLRVYDVSNTKLTAYKFVGSDVSFNGTYRFVAALSDLVRY